jgi:hypothetical protein
VLVAPIQLEAVSGFIVACGREDFIFSSEDENREGLLNFKNNQTIRHELIAATTGQADIHGWVATAPLAATSRPAASLSMALLSTGGALGKIGVIQVRREQDTQSRNNLFNVAQIAGIHFVQYHPDLRADGS